jgi:hypothetical protein
VEIGVGKRSSSIDFTLGPAVFNRRVHTLDLAGLFQAPVMCGRKGREGTGRRRAAQKSDHRHRLLRARREGPRRCRAAEQGDERLVA